MADVKLTGNANWSTFKAGVTNGDTVYMNGFTLTIDEAITAYSNCVFTNAAGGTVSASAGGSVVLGGNFNVTLAGLTCSTTNSTALFQINTARTATLTLGTCQAGAGYVVVIQTGAGSVLTFVNTTFIGGTGSFCHGLYAAIGCTLTFTNCTATGGAGTSAHGVSPGVAGVTASGTLNLTQSASTGANSAAFYPTAGSGSLSGSVVHRSAGNTWRNEGGTWDYTITSETITGSIVGNGNQGLWMVLGSGVSTITRPAGSITHSVATHYSMKQAATAVLTLVGDVTCGTNGSNYVAYDSSAGSGSLTVNGTVTGPSTNFGGVSGLAAVASGKVFVKNVTVGAAGTLPSLTNVCFMSNSQIVAPISGSNITLVNSASAGDYPSAANVRSGTSYAYGALTGTCAVPGASSVASGVSVDNTTGTAVLTAANVRSAVGLATANLDTQLQTINEMIDTEVAAIKAKTDNLPTDPADQSAVEAAIMSATSGLASQTSVNSLTAYVDTEVAAIKAKTDNLPADPADQSSVEAAITAAVALLATAAELAKVPKVGSTHRYTQVASDSNLKTADVSIGAVV